MDTLLHWSLLFTVSLHAHLLEVDNLGHLYAVGQDNVLVKMDSAGNVLFTYPQNRYGPLRQVDVSNPMKILLIYPDFAQVVILDNTLSELGQISLKRIGINDLSAAAYSRRDNGIWIFDRGNRNLKKIDLSGTLVLNAPELLQQLGITLEPSLMREYQNRLYLSDPQQGVFVFDAFGVFLEKLPLPPLRDFQISSGFLIGLADNQTVVVDLNSGTQSVMALPHNVGCTGLRHYGNRWYLLCSTGLLGYRN